jgi:hypothetical protein
VDGHQEPASEDEVDLGRLDLAAVVEIEQDDVDDVVVVGLDLRPLVALGDVLGDQRMKTEVSGDRSDDLRRGVDEIDPDAGRRVREHCPEHSNVIGPCRAGR